MANLTPEGKPMNQFEYATQFKVGDKIVNLTAQENKWPDQEGEIVEIDGSNFKIKYKSGSERWKMVKNIAPQEESQK